MLAAGCQILGSSFNAFSWPTVSNALEQKWKGQSPYEIVASQSGAAFTASQSLSLIWLLLLLFENQAGRGWVEIGERGD